MPIMTRTSGGIYKKVNKIYDLAGHEISKVYDVAGNLVYKVIKDVSLINTTVYKYNYLNVKDGTTLYADWPAVKFIKDANGNTILAKDILGKRIEGTLYLTLSLTGSGSFHCDGYSCHLCFTPAEYNVTASNLTLTHGMDNKYSLGSYTYNVNGNLPTSYKNDNDKLGIICFGAYTTIGANPSGKNAYFTVSASFNNGILHM